MERFRARRDRLAGLLALSDFPVPASRPPAAAPKEPGVIPLRPRAGRAQTAWRDRAWLRAAAVVLLLTAAVVVATPARAWIIAWVGRQWDRLSHGEQVSPPRRPAAPVPAPAAPRQASAQVRFVPAGSELRVEVAHPQAAGALTLVPASGASAAAEVVGGPSVELLVVPSGLRIRNAPGLSAEYRVEVPSAVRRVRVRVGDGREMVVDRSDIPAEGTRLPLTDGA
jgi:hypothetical protein